MTIRVVLADDHPMYRYGLTAILEQADGINVVASVGDGAELVSAVGELSPDVVLTDLSMPGLDGVAVTTQLLKRAAGAADSRAHHARGRRARLRGAACRRPRISRQGR